MNNNKEILEKIITHFLKEIEFQKKWVREAKFDINDAIEEGKDEGIISIKRKMLEKKEWRLEELKQMLGYVQDLHYKEEMK